MTKNKMRKASISTNIIAEMGKDEPVAMECFERITISTQCGLGDIVKIIMRY